MRRWAPASLALLLAACSSADSPGSPPSVGEPLRIVVLAPAAAEMLDAMGWSDRIVGIGEFGPWPAGLGELPVIGGYDRPNVETVLSLQANLLFTAASQAGQDAHQRLASLGVRVIALDTSTYDGVFESIARVGEILGEQDEAGALARRIRGEIEELSDRAAGLPRRRVLIVVGRDPLYVAGPGSHLDEIVRLVGGENVAHDALAPYQQISVETMLERMPEVIIDTSDNRPGAVRGRDLGFWRRWDFLPAVRDERVYGVDPGRLVIPGIRLPAMTRLIGRLLHPEVFGEPTADELGPLATDETQR